MAAITTRQTAGTGAIVAGVPLTNTQIDNNFININTDLDGKVSLSGFYSNPTWITSLAETKVLPNQSTNSGKYLTTNGTSTSWSTVPLPSGQTAGSSTAGYLQYSGTVVTAGQINSSITAPTGTTRLNYEGNFYATNFYGNGSNLTNLTASNLSGTVAVANGGTGATSASITSFNNITGYTASGATGTTSTNLVFSTSPSLTTPSLSSETFSTSAAVTAGTNAQGQGALTSDYNVITTASSNPSGVTLPIATVGRRVIVVNKGANTINVYPASSAAIDALGTNISIAIISNGWMMFNASSTAQWYSSANIYVNNAVYTTSSYTDPSWITSLSEIKVLPSQSGQSGRYLTTNASSTSWSVVSLPSGQTAGFATSGYIQYSGTTATSGQINGGNTTPTGTTRLNYEGYLYSTQFYSDSIVASKFLQSPYRIIAPFDFSGRGTGTLREILPSISTGNKPNGIQVDQSNRFLYVAYYNSGGAGTVGQYSINQSTGALTEITTAIAAGTGSYAVGIDKLGRYVYVANYGGNTISQYSINQSTGALTQITTAIASGTNPYTITIDPTSRFVYVTNYNQASISQYSINQGTGALTQITTAFGTAILNPVDIVADPSGRFVYVAHYNSGGAGSVMTLSINQTTGALTQVGSTIAAGNGSYAIDIDPTGRFVYVANFNGAGPGSISQYSINQSTGALTQITTAIATGTSPQSLTVDPTGKFVYVTNASSGTVGQYSINQSTGALTQITTAISTGFTAPNTSAIDQAGKFLYVTNINSNVISQYTINNFGFGSGTVSGSLSIEGPVSPRNIYESLASITGATGVVTHNCTGGMVFNHTSIAANFTANFTNFGLAAGFSTGVILILNQGATAYIPSAVQIAGVAQTINWAGGTAPSGSANKKDIVSFSFTNIGGTYTVFGQLVSFG